MTNVSDSKSYAIMHPKCYDVIRRIKQCKTRLARNGKKFPKYGHYSRL